VFKLNSKGTNANWKNEKQWANGKLSG